MLLPNKNTVRTLQERFTQFKDIRMIISRDVLATVIPILNAQHVELMVTCVATQNILRHILAKLPTAQLN